MKINKIFLIVALFTLALAGSALATGSCTFSDPTTNTNNCLTGATNSLTATCSGLGADENFTDVCFNLGTTLLGCNSTFNLSIYTFNFDSTAQSDTASGTINLTYTINGTTNFSTSFTSIEVDNTAPTITLTTFEAQEQGEFGLSKCTGSDGVDSALSYSLLLNYVEENTNNTAESTANTGSTPVERLYTSADLQKLGRYRGYCVVTDNCGNSGQGYAEFTNLDGEQDTVTISEVTNNQIGTTAQKDNKKTALIGAVFVLFVCIAGLIFYNNQEKNKNKK